MSRLIVLLLVVTLVVGYQIQAQPSIFSILGDSTCQLIYGQCPINKGTTPVCSYSKSCDSSSCTVHFCLYGSGPNGVTQDLVLHFTGKTYSIRSPGQSNKNCNYKGLGTEYLQVGCSCEGECYVQADYIITYLN